MDKNRLQEFAQKSAMPLPVYETVNIGHVHSPQFRSTVLVDGLKFTSETFFNRKAAEQHAAKLAFESISRKIEDESISLIQEDKRFCKSILHEYAVRMSHEKPTYKTCQAEEFFPVFNSSIIYNGKTYTGCPAKNKKEAEQMAAYAVIESILAQSDTRSLMCEIISSKRKLYAAIGTTGCFASLSSESVPLRSQNNKLSEGMHSGNEQISKANAIETVTPESKIIEEGYTRELSFEGKVSGCSQLTSPEGSSLVVMASGASNSFDGSLPHEHVNNAAEKVGSSARPEGSPGLVLAHGMKRPDATENEESESKKSRTAEWRTTPVADPWSFTGNV